MQSYPQTPAAATPARTGQIKALIPLIAVHAFSFVSWVIFMGSLAGLEDQIRKAYQGLIPYGEFFPDDYRSRVTSFAWFLCVALTVIMISHVCVVAVPQMRCLQSFVAILLGVLLAWFGTLLDNFATHLRELPGGQFKDIRTALNASIAGAILVTVAILGALVLVTCEFEKVEVNSAPPLFAPPSMQAGVVPPYGNARDAPYQGGEMQRAACPPDMSVTPVDSKVQHTMV